MMTKENSIRLHAMVEGYVQGVGFRYFVLKNAQALGLTGWVRNTFRQQVEVIAEGSRPTLEQLETLLQHGPASATVTSVQSTWLDATGEFSDFSVRF